MSRNIGGKIRELRRTKGLSQDQLSRASGLTTSYIGRIERWEEGYDNPTYGTLEAIAKGLGVSTIDLIADEGATRSGNNLGGSSGDQFHGLQKIPLLSGTVSAGLFTTSFDDWSGETIAMPVKDAKNKVAWKIKGNSMAPKFEEGDLAIIDCGIQFMDGDDVVAENGNGVTIKQLKILKDGSVELRPLNPEYETMKMESSEDLEILGVVIGCYRDMRRRKK